ncbi:MAG: ROK family protein [Gammaproteobacteria bacterium]|nr:ROK family protein [Gammaproteobacteria bacterium]
MKQAVRIGVDLGGTKIEAIALDAAGKPLMRRRVETPCGDYVATVSRIVTLIEGIESDLGQQGHVGVGIPGAISPSTGRVKNANSTCLIGQALDRDLEHALDRPVRLANDANCFAISEATDGAGADASVVFGVILGTGCGGGIVVNGRLLTGPNAIAGEWGHNPMPWPEADELSTPCYCGRKGCIETWLSGPGLARDYQQHGGQALSAIEIAKLAETAGDERAHACLVRYEERLARALASVINVLDPDVIVLGGGMSNLQRLYLNVPNLWGPYIFSDTVTTRLLQNRHGDSSGVRGAAWLWPAC